MTEGLCHWSRSRAVENRARSVGGHTVCTECAVQEVARRLRWVLVRGRGPVKVRLLLPVRCNVGSESAAVWGMTQILGVAQKMVNRSTP